MSRDTYWNHSQGPELFTVGNSALYNTATVATELGWVRTTDIAGTSSSSGTTVTGSSTPKFLSDLRVGSRITNGSQVRTVTAIASDSSLTTNSAFNPALSGATVQRIDEVLVAIGELLTKKTDVASVPTFTLTLPANADYNTGETMTFTIAASEAVLVQGAPYIVLTIGTTARNAVYDPVTSTDTSLKFKYTVVAADADANGIAVANTITLGTGGNIGDKIIGGQKSIAPASLTYTVGTTTGITVNQP